MTETMIEIQSLSAGYGKLVVLHELSLTFRKNQFTAILGPNGSGKSTLLKSIFGLTNILGGSIQFEGKELVGLPTEGNYRCGSERRIPARLLMCHSARTYLRP